ncbi:GFA family protein [Aestuariibacter halophilus]|uniref:GFA family protein n=1 Tax=Fluctibacter halophilus TaxID=226011 RepID=A0ABS8GAH4_9ALTE|nr:GFA family protein [Aestuariibacter halophilus]MCC2617171.1 GFA family protein [Aestuariibacter halophilus]
MKVLQGKGHCLCKAVTVTADSVKASVGACHCSMCRTWGGGPLLALECGSDVHFTGQDNIGRFASSDWAERGFCRRCGTHLFYHLREQDAYILPAGLLDLSAELMLDHEIFVDEQPPYYCFANDTRKMTGAEVFAAYAPPDQEKE